MRPGLVFRVGCSIAALLSAGCASKGVVKAVPVASPAPTLPSVWATGVGVEPKTIDPRRREGVAIRYQLAHPGSVWIDLVDEEGRVWRQHKLGRQTAGFHRVRWDGRTKEGQAVPKGAYRYVIHVQDGRGRQEIHDPSVETWGEELELRDFTFDPSKGFFRWKMPKAGWARLRVGLQGFPHLRTLLDWEPLEAGEQTFHWDGLDASGFIHLKEHPQLSVNLSAFSLPHNTIIVRGDPPRTTGRSQAATYPPLFNQEAGYLHARHPRSVCREVWVRIEFPNSLQVNPQGCPLLSGVVPVRVTLDERDAVHSVNQRFEVALFEDTTFLFEEEEGLNPFTYLWDTTHLSKGEHLLTVNILSYDDHYGVETQRVFIGEIP